MRFLPYLSTLALARCVVAILPDGRPHANVAPRPVQPAFELPSARMTPSKRDLPPYNTIYWFDQLIDHDDPSLGTFRQRYFFTSEFYEPGGPIVFNTPGEVAVDGYSGYLTNRTMNGAIAQQEHGAAVVLEHRFYGESNPYPDLKTESLRVHTIKQAIEDIEYFAYNVKFPMDNGTSVTPDVTPWIMTGGSYSGALTSFTMFSKPDLMWAGYASSATVQNIQDFWRYFEPTREYMDKNCSADVSAVIAYIDETFSGDDQDAIFALKQHFNVSDVTHLDDIAGAFRNNIWTWQSLGPSSPRTATFYAFCDWLEVDSETGEVAGEEGWGLEHALQAWGTYWNSTWASLCGDLDGETCLGSYDPSLSTYTNTDVGYTWRSWDWIVCNEVGFFEDGPPADVTFSPIVSRLINVDTNYDPRQCAMMYPEAFSEPAHPDVDETNKLYGGWNVTTERLFFAVGSRDPWREATFGANGITTESTDRMPIVMSDGFHCSDLSIAQGATDGSIGDLQKQALAYMHDWVAEWK